MPLVKSRFTHSPSEPPGADVSESHGCTSFQCSAIAKVGKAACAFPTFFSKELSGLLDVCRCPESSMITDKTLTTAPVECSTGVDAEFVDLRGLEARFGIRRSSAYTLIAEREIRSVVLRRHGTIKGRRLVDVASVRNFLARQPSDVDPVMSRNCRKAQKAATSRERNDQPINTR